MHSFAEIKMWARTWLLSYRFADFSAEEHAAMIERAAAQVAPWLDAPGEVARLTARSVGHYLAQSQLRPRSSRIATEIIAAFLLLPGLLRWLVEGRVATSQRQARTKGVRWNQSEFVYCRNPAIFHTPDELKADAPSTVFVSARYLRPDDLRFLWQVTRLGWKMLPGLRLQWVFKLAKEIAWARPLIDAHPAEYALLDAECNCALSILTLYAHRHGQQLYDVQHGDLFLSAGNCLFETDRCYVWEEFYADLLRQMRVRSDFRIYPNPAFLLSDAEKRIPRNGIGVFMPGSLTLSAEEEKQVFADALNRLAERHPVRLRPHPAYANECLALAPLLSPAVEITDPTAENSKQFILRHSIIVGSVSAALLEAVMLGWPVVCFRGKYLDDIARYHFSYRKPNCHVCTLAELADKVQAQCAEANAGYVAAG